MVAMTDDLGRGTFASAWEPTGTATSATFVTAHGHYGSDGIYFDSVEVFDSQQNTKADKRQRHIEQMKQNREFDPRKFKRR